MNGVERSERPLAAGGQIEAELIELDAPLDCYVFDPEALASDMGLDRSALTTSRAYVSDPPPDDLRVGSSSDALGDGDAEGVGSRANEPDDGSPPLPDALALPDRDSVEQEHAVRHGDPRISDSGRELPHEYDEAEFWSEVASLHRVISADPELRGALLRFGSPLHTAIACVAAGVSHSATRTGSITDAGTPAGGASVASAEARGSTQLHRLFEELEQSGAAALVVAHQQRGSALRAAGGNRG